MGAAAKSYMRKGFLIYEEMRKYLVIYEEAVSHIWLCNRSLLDFLTYEESLVFFFYQCVVCHPTLCLKLLIPIIFKTLAVAWMRYLRMIGQFVCWISLHMLKLKFLLTVLVKTLFETLSIYCYLCSLWTGHSFFHMVYHKLSKISRPRQIFKFWTSVTLNIDHFGSSPNQGGKGNTPPPSLCLASPSSPCNDDILCCSYDYKYSLALAHTLDVMCMIYST